MPALIRFDGASSGAGFSTNRSTRWSSASSTTPKALGSSTGDTWIVASAPEARWASSSFEMSRSVMMSPLATTNVSSMPAWSAAKRIAPAVSSGSGSTA